MPRLAGRIRVGMCPGAHWGRGARTREASSTRRRRGRRRPGRLALRMSGRTQPGSTPGPRAVCLGGARRWSPRNIPRIRCSGGPRAGTAPATRTCPAGTNHLNRKNVAGSECGDRAGSAGGSHPARTCARGNSRRASHTSRLGLHTRADPPSPTCCAPRTRPCRGGRRTRPRTGEGTGPQGRTRRPGPAHTANGLGCTSHPRSSLCRTRTGRARRRSRCFRRTYVADYRSTGCRLCNRRQA